MDMKQHLPAVDLEKLQAIVSIKQRYLDGKLSLQEAREELKSQVQTLQPYEIALAEQELQEFDQDECRKEDIQQTLDLFDGILNTSPLDLPEDHPLAHYMQENEAMRKLLKEVERLAPYPVIKNEWLALYDELRKWFTHLSRKQNQLYPLLERKGFDRPTTTMWLLDDFVRDEIKQARQLIEANRDEEFIKMQPTIIADVLDLIQKEETVLYPTSYTMITAQEFEEMKSGDREIGFAFINPAPQGTRESKATQTESSPAASAFLSDLAGLLGKYGFGQGTSPGELLKVATGELSLEEINLIYKHMPVDLSYVDENELVRFYTDTEHRIFPRSRNVIGRDVKNCHPRTSVHLVEEIIDKFRRGEEDEVDFWINKPEVFIYIKYVAVRDEQGRFRGVLEMMQDCTRIRSLEGSRTLLSWDKSNKAAAKESKSSQEDRPETAQTAPEETAPSSTDTDLQLNSDTRLKHLLDQHPWLKKELPEINPAFKMLNSPLARVMIPRATLSMMSERSGMPLDALIRAIQERIIAHR